MFWKEQEEIRNKRKETLQRRSEQIGLFSQLYELNGIKDIPRKEAMAKTFTWGFNLNPNILHTADFNKWFNGRPKDLDKKMGGKRFLNAGLYSHFEACRAAFVHALCASESTHRFSYGEWDKAL